MRYLSAIRFVLLGAVLALALSACTTPRSTPGTYHQGVPVAPRAPLFNPITDSPHTVGHPGHLAPAPRERSPHKRVLPPTREPTLFSGDQPRAMRPDAHFMVGGVVLQPPDEATDVDVQVMRTCALLLTSFLEKQEVQSEYARLTLGERMCAIAKAYTACGERGGKRARDRGLENAAKQMDRIAVAGVSFQGWACEPIRDTDAVRDWMLLLTPHWRAPWP
jgi:hypothetical protein